MAFSNLRAFAAKSTQWMRAFDFLRRRKMQYQFTFDSPSGVAVLKDLARFCRAAKTEFHPDARIHAALSGRREVFLRIVEHLTFTPEALTDIYFGAEDSPKQDN